MEAEAIAPVLDKPKRALVQVGDVFGRLTVKQFMGSRGKNIYWRCRCACGKTVTRCTHDLRRIENASCGCARRKHGWTDELDEEIVAMRATCSLGEIAERIGRPYEAVRSRLRLLGTSLDRRRPRASSLRCEPLGYLEMAPGHFATDARSYELIVGASE